MQKNELAEKYSRTYKTGQSIFNEGDFGREMYILLKGQVEIFRIIDGKKNVLATLKEGDIFGEIALLDRFPRSANAAAVVDSVVIVVNSISFDNILTQNTEFAKKIIKMLAARIRSTNDIIVSMYQKDREDKIVSALNQFYRISMQNREIKIKDAVDRAKFLEYCERIKGLPPKVVELQLLNLKKNGIVELSQNVIALLKTERRLQKREGESQSPEK